VLTGTTTLVVQAEYIGAASDAKVWQTVDTFTASGNKVFRFAATRRMRLDLTVDGGGTHYAELTCGNKG
jgi:hypothetical protein